MSYNLDLISLRTSGTIPPNAVRFHANCGTNIVLSNDNRTAERIRGHDHGIVICAYPVMKGRIYEFHLDKKDPALGDYIWLNDKAFMYVGVTIEPPENLCLPGDAGEWGHAVVINNTHITLRGQYLTGNTVGKDLENLPEGSTLGLALDQQQGLRLYINGKDQGVVIRLTVPFPCYPFIDIIGPYRKITALPIKPMKPEPVPLKFTY